MINMDMIIEKIKKQIEKGIIPTKQDFIDNKMLLYYDDIVTPSLEKDPSIIVLLKENLLNKKYCDIIINKNIRITEEMIKENPALTKYKNVMEKAINENPAIIRYIQCQISKETISKALQSYKITKEDLMNNSYLKENQYIVEQNPELYYYSMYASKIIELKEAIENNPLSIKKLDLFANKQNYINKIVYFVSKLKETEETIDQNRSYKNLLKIIDRITEIRYKKEKQNFEFTDIISINYKMIKTFEETIKTNNTTLINLLGKQLFEFTHEKIRYDIIKSKLIEYYNEYLERQSLNINQTNRFCNKILNCHRDYYKSNEQEKIIEELKQVLQLTKKKIEQIYKSRKINKLTILIKNKKLDLLGIENSETILKESMYQVKKDIETNKTIIKNNMHLTPEQFKKLEEKFLENGTLNIEIVKNITNCNDKKIIKYIVNKYEKIKLKFLDKIILEDRSITENEKSKIGLNTNNFIINDKEKKYFTLSMLLYNITEKEIDLILQNEKYFNDFNKILTFCDISSELDLKTVKKIFTQYGKIVESSEQEFIKQETIYSNIDEIIMRAKGLNKNNDICIEALGKNIIAKVGESYSSDYLEMYKKMLRKNYSHIPSVDLKYGNLELKSGDYFNPERLLIGKCPPGSCIDLNNVAGERTYKECLLKPESDVILIRKQNMLVDRIFAFRRGNVIQLVTQNKHEYPLELFEQIKNQMLEQIKKDNIDYIVVNQTALKEKKLKMIKDGKYTTLFPHSDASEEVYVLYSNEKNYQFSATPEGKYYKKRLNINYSPTLKEINRIIALNAYINNTNKIEFEINSRTVCGEDWLLIEHNNEIEEIILNPEDPIAQQEMEQAKEYLETIENDKHL